MNTEFLNQVRIREGDFASEDSDGFNGLFEFFLPILSRPIRVIASDGLGWQHVSVSMVGCVLPPSWHVMSQVKDLFWGPDEWVVQFHPPWSEHINNHPGCLHLWKCTDGREQPTPPGITVGIKELGVLTPITGERYFNSNAERSVAMATAPAQVPQREANH